MDLTVGSRLKHAWNAFLNRAPTGGYQYGLGGGYSYRPDRIRFTRGNERSIVTSVYNRMEDLIYTMVLSDGTIIENLRKNGDNYISASKLTADMFEGKLSEVTVKTSEDEVVMENMDLVQITEMDGEYWFVLRQFSATELAMAKMSSNIDFLAMMQDVEL